MISKIGREINPAGKSGLNGIGCQSQKYSEFQKYGLTADPNHFYIQTVLSHSEGRLAIVTDAGQDAMDADGAEDGRYLTRTAKSCGPDASAVGVKRAEQSAWRRCQQSPITGESTK
jgi:hypothetical protein